MQTAINNDYKRMVETPVPKLIRVMAVPTVISMLITNIYNLADAYFVGRIGTSASGAIGIMLSLQGILQAFGFMFGQGAGSNISRKLGAKDTESASKYASVSFFYSFGTGLVIGILGLVFLKPFLYLLGCTDTIYPYARAYGIYILLAAPFFTSSCTMNNILRFEGRATFAMVGLSLGGILNMVGDPILMFGLHMGMYGAGLSTAISQLISFCILISMFLRKKTACRLSIKDCQSAFKELTLITKTGLPSLIRQGLNSFSTMVLNICARRYGDYVIAGMSIVSRVSMFIVSIVIGIGQSLQPVAAYNYGAKKFQRVRDAYFYVIKLAEGFLFVIVILGFCFSAQIISVFQKDPGVVEIGVLALRFQCISLFVQPISIYSHMVFQCTGKTFIASVLSSLRSGVYFIPIVLILPCFIGVLGIQMAQMLADILTTLTALPFAIGFMRQLSSENIE